MIGLLLAEKALMKYDPILFKIFAILEIVGGGNPPAKLKRVGFLFFHYNFGH